MRLRRILGALMVGTLMTTASAAAYAGPLDKRGSSAQVKVKKPPSRAAGGAAASSGGRSGSGPVNASGRARGGAAGPSGPSAQEVLTGKRQGAIFGAAIACALAPAACAGADANARKTLDALGTGNLGGLPAVGGPAGGAGAPAVGAPQKTPGELAQEAIAAITATSGEVGAGPNLEDSGLTKMDAPVGYPVWLWVEDDPGTISDSATDGDLTVSLSANISSVTYTMGDGTTRTCDGLGTKWSTSVTPASKSPTCGYIYQKMGRYTITATSTWNGTWSGGGEAGTFTLTSTATRPYVVGELQTIIR